MTRMVGSFGPSGFLVSGCLALVNVFVPLLILRLVTAAAAVVQYVGAPGLAGGGCGAAVGL